jgi:hypothetical protein
MAVDDISSVIPVSKTGDGLSKGAIAGIVIGSIAGECSL